MDSAVMDRHIEQRAKCRGLEIARTERERVGIIRGGG